MKKTVFFLLLFFVAGTISASHKVYIIHGYGNPKEIMNKIDRAVIASGFITENYAYPGFTEDLDSIGKQLYEYIKAENFDSVSFVTHSMGGLVVRTMLKYSGEDPEFPMIYRIVMITPPNQGADIADFFKTKGRIRKILGPNVAKMETDSCSFANCLPTPLNIEVGIMIGIRGKKKGYNRLIEGDNDGLLKPERAYLGNEKDVIIMKHNHFEMTQKKKAIKQVVVFLKKGVFNKKQRV